METLYLILMWVMIGCLGLTVLFFVTWVLSGAEGFERITTCCLIATALVLVFTLVICLVTGTCDAVCFPP